MPEADDNEAMSRLKRGDIGGLESLVKRHQETALKTAYLVTGDRDLAADVVQSIFLRVYERAHQFDNSRPFEPWLLRIVVNDAVKAARRNKRHVSIDESGSDGEAGLVDLLPDAGQDPSELAEQAERREAVSQALLRLSPGQRAIVVQRFYLGMTEAEIAMRSGRSSGTVKRLMYRAKQRLQVLLLGAFRTEGTGE